MSHPHQDWKPVVFSKKKSSKKSTTVNKVSKSKVNSNNKFSGTGKKVTDDSEVKRIPTVGIEIGKQIQAARCAKKMTQKELAQKMHMQQQTVQQHENGKATKNNGLLAKFERALGVKLKR
jgi:putative transcription factor